MKYLVVGFSFLFALSTYSQNAGLQNGVDTDTKGISIGNIVKMSGNWFIAYRNGIKQRQADDNINSLRTHEDGFILKRSYFTLKKKLDKTFSVRYTMDLTVDREGSDAGNVETRLKYLYVKAKPTINSSVFTGTWLEVGMVHTPWLDFEQKINTYRVQDNMFIERNRIFNSADFGVTIGGNIGAKMDADFLKEYNGAMPGKWLSYCFGIYNGGGYSGVENNANKVFSMRLSSRPFANSFPQLQLSGYFNIGNGNSEHYPKFNQFLSFVTYTGKQLTLTAQHHLGTGDFRARYVHKDNPSRAFDNNGYSFFGEYRFKKSGLAFWVRYDYFYLDKVATNDITKRIIGGVTYRINKNLRVVVNAEHNSENREKNDIYEVNLEVSF